MENRTANSETSEDKIKRASSNLFVGPSGASPLHWDAVYRSRQDEQISWHQRDPGTSLRWIIELTQGRGRVIDVGGGSSTLIDRLLEHAFDKLAVLDISEAALERTRARLGVRADRVQWTVADVAAIDSLGEFDVWHDRAVFHFLTDLAHRQRYIHLARRTLPVGGHLVLATFAPDGPERCSALDVCRYDANALAATFGAGFDLIRGLRETHRTPWGDAQAFQYVLMRRTP